MIKKYVCKLIYNHKSDSTAYIKYLYFIGMKIGDYAMKSI